MNDMIAGDAIAEALFGRTRRNVLALLFGDPDSSFYLRQIIRLTGSGVGAVQRELATLEEAGLVERSPEGNQVYFRANRSSPVFKDLRGLVDKTMGIVDVLRSALRKVDVDDAVRCAFLYGSVAEGSHGTGSDVDMMIVGSIQLGDLVGALRMVEDRLSREVNPSVFGIQEFRDRIAAEDHFVSRVLAGPKVMLIGGDDELAGLGGEPLDP